MAKEVMSNGGQLTIASARDWNITVRKNGKVRQIKNFKNGEAASFTPTADEFSSSAGFYGDQQVLKSSDQSYKGTLNLFPGSDDFKFFNALFTEQDEATGTTPDTFDIIVENTANGYKATGEGCFVTGRPQIPTQNTDATSAVSIHISYWNDQSDQPDKMFN